MPVDKGYKRLCESIARGDLDQLKERAAEDPESVRHWKPVVDAAFAGRADLLAALLDAGADANVVSGVSARHTPLTRIAQHHSTIPKHAGHIEAMRLLLARGADPNLPAGPHGFVPLAYSAMAADTEQMEVLADSGTAIDIHIAAILLDLGQLRGFLDDEASANAADARGRTPLQYVALSGLWQERPKAAIECAELLLSRGADVNSAEEMAEGDEVFHATPLWRTLSWQRNVPLAEFLLERGADPNPAVFTATFDGSDAICDLLDRHGANWEQRFHGRTPLMDLMHFRRPAGAAWLLRRGVDVNAKAPNGRTALHYAAWQGVRADYVEALLAAGADRTARDADGKTPLDLAREKKRTKLLGMLA